MLNASYEVDSVAAKLVLRAPQQARQAHNLKVIGSNPIPQPEKAAQSETWRLCFFLSLPRETLCQHCVNKSRGAQWRREAVVPAWADQLRSMTSPQRARLLRQLRHPLPVEVDTVAGSCGRQSHALV